MTDNVCKRPRLALLVCVEKTLRNPSVLLEKIRLLRRRFELRVVLAFKEPEFLFFNTALVQRLPGSEVERVIATDSPDRLLGDALEYAQRLEADRIYLCKADALVDSFLEVVRFLVETQFEARPRLSRDEAVAALLQSTLGQVPYRLYEDFAQVVAAQRQRDGPSVAANMAALPAARSLYATAAGVHRFGGLERFSRLPLQVGGQPIASFKRYWLISNQLTSQAFSAVNKRSLAAAASVEVPGVLDDGMGARMLVDINPITSHASVGGVPRQLLSITRFDMNGAPLSARGTAVFVMSNFNKQDYLCASMYGVAMQTHPDCELDMIDDVSTDPSMSIAKQFLAHVDRTVFPVRLAANASSRGTYWIRNSIIHEHLTGSASYLINDSDDFSSAQRAAIQTTLLQQPDSPAVLNFGDIVRVDKGFRPMPVDGKAERYGTAALCAAPRTHLEFGYYENLRKNADTEFIERVKKFGGRAAVHWFRYPLLFQTFDGNNLTADIYSREDGALKANLSVRDLHRTLFKQRHGEVTRPLVKHYAFPDYSFSQAYEREIPELLVPARQTEDSTP